MQINVINVANQTVPTAKGSYQALEVTYKEVATSKVASRKIMSFVNDSKPAFEALSQATNGEIFTISMVKQPGKDGKDYWVWTNATKGGAAAPAQGQSAASPAASVVSKGTWETPTERAQKQIYIVRQSSISNAIDTLAVGSKTPPKPEEVLKLAKQYEDFVFNGLTGNFAEDTKSLEDEDLFQSLPQ